MKESIFSFTASFIMQFVWYVLVHPDRGVTLVDMFFCSLLFAVMFFFTGRIWRFQKTKKSE